jgi:uncharacterized iron-regulated protein
MITRRRCLLAAGGLSLVGVGCATTGVSDERIVEVASGRLLTRTELLATLRASDFALLGERHDNPHHHARRGELLAGLRAPAAVVAEQLPRGQRVVFGGDIAASLNAAGFDATGWAWPRHEPLFAGAAKAGLPVSGGNIDRELARRIAREGPSAWPAELAAVIDQAPLDAAAQAALDATLVAGHCGHLPVSRAAPLRAAQRARDAALWLAMEASGGRPAVLLAGNGHVRRDYGVPQLIAALRPTARVVSVGMLETGEAVEAAPYTHVWVTPSAERGDPCQDFRMTRPPAPSASAAR